MLQDSEALRDKEGKNLSPLELGQALGEKRVLRPGEAVRVQPLEPLMLSNSGGAIALYEKPEVEGSKGRRIDRVHYTGKQAGVEGVPVIFSKARGLMDN